MNISTYFLLFIFSQEQIWLRLHFRISIQNQSSFGMRVLSLGKFRLLSDCLSTLQVCVLGSNIPTPY